MTKETKFAVGSLCAPATIVAAFLLADVVNGRYPLWLSGTVGIDMLQLPLAEVVRWTFAAALFMFVCYGPLIGLMWTNEADLESAEEAS